MSKASKDFRDRAARELRTGRAGGTRSSRAANLKRAAAYKSLADAEEWLQGEKSRSQKRPRRRPT